MLPTPPVWRGIFVPLAGRSIVAHVTPTVSLPIGIDAWEFTLQPILFRKLIEVGHGLTVGMTSMYKRLRGPVIRMMGARVTHEVTGVEGALKGRTNTQALSYEGPPDVPTQEPIFRSRNHYIRN